MENKEIALNLFRENVFKEYKKCQNNYFELLKIVGEIVRISQDIEFELKQLLKEELKIEMYLERKMAKKLVDLLDQNGFFKTLYEQEKDDLIKRLNTVIDCRNWVIHAGLKEYEGTKKCVDSGIFMHIVQTTELFKANTNPYTSFMKKPIQTGGYEELENNIKNAWENACNIDFNCKEHKIGDPLIGSEKDWTSVKIVITKYLMYEFLDRFKQNIFSIYA